MQLTATILSRSDTRGKRLSVVYRAEIAACLIIVVIIISSTLRIGAVFANGNLDALAREAFAERCALTDTREFLGRVDREDLAEAGCEHRCLPLVYH